MFPPLVFVEIVKAIPPTDMCHLGYDPPEESTTGIRR
jgi:hypothetical protein